MNAVLLNTTFQLASTAYTYSGTWHKYYFAGSQRIAMRTCSSTTCTAPTYFLSDHLGSTSLSVNIEGTMVSTMLYSPWGETRYGTSATPYQYEGQFSNMSDFGLLFFNARWVDPLIGRFTSPDSIIPESQGVQAWDRYAFVNNNPLRYTDPSGHCILICIGIAVGVAIIAAAITPALSEPIVINSTQPRIENNPNSSPCTASLATCYQQGKLSPLSNDRVDSEDFNQLLETVATDIKDGMALPTIPVGFLAGRGTFDTPFYNGGGLGGSDNPPFSAEQQVCISGEGCWARSEVNYFAQGMWGADAGESLQESIDITNWWNEFAGYNLPPSEMAGKIYWTEYGWKWYKNWQEWGDDWRDHWHSPEQHGATAQ